MTLTSFLLLALAVVAIYTDLKYHKIYNFLTFPAIILGPALSFFYGGYNALISNLFGMALGFVVLLLPFILGGMGGGDVKFLASIGALGGYPYILWAVAYMAFIGGVMAAAGLMRQRQLKQSAYKLKKVTIPYGVAIGLGAIIALFVRL